MSYSKLALRTLSPNYFPQHFDDAQLKIALAQAIDAAEFLDKAKKVIFYGKANTDHTVYTGVHDKSGTVTADAFHAIVGLITEAGELAEALLNALDNGIPLDLVNVGEEGGDILWYIELLAKATNTTRNQMEIANIKKLSNRYPSAEFDAFLADNRNLEIERKDLEKDLT